MHVMQARASDYIAMQIRQKLILNSAIKTPI